MEKRTTLMVEMPLRMARLLDVANGGREYRPVVGGEHDGQAVVCRFFVRGGVVLLSVKVHEWPDDGQEV